MCHIFAFSFSLPQMCSHSYSFHCSYFYLLLNHLWRSDISLQIFQCHYPKESDTFQYNHNEIIELRKFTFIKTDIQYIVCIQMLLIVLMLPFQLSFFSLIQNPIQDHALHVVIMSIWPSFSFSLFFK